VTKRTQAVDPPGLAVFRPGRCGRLESREVAVGPRADGVVGIVGGDHMHAGRQQVGLWMAVSKAADEEGSGAAGNHHVETAPCPGVQAGQSIGGRGGGWVVEGINGSSPRLRLPVADPSVPGRLRTVATTPCRLRPIHVPPPMGSRKAKQPHPGSAPAAAPELTPNPASETALASRRRHNRGVAGGRRRTAAAERATGQSKRQQHDDQSDTHETILELERLHGDWNRAPTVMAGPVPAMTVGATACGSSRRESVLLVTGYKSTRAALRFNT
jgi:hypothetical protein